MVLLPALVGAVCGLLLYKAVPQPASIAGSLAWWSLVVGGPILSVIVLTRVMQRCAPLAFLLSLTLVFPDEAPSRFKVARTAVRLKRKGERRGDASEGAEHVLALVAALGSHDQRTRGHSERVRVFTEMLAEEIGLSEGERDRLRWAALLHDIGKLVVPAEILNKSDRPNDREWAILHRHPTEGIRIAAPLLQVLGPWAGAIEHHHERYDGRGYPAGLRGDSIPYGARILAVSDAYEVMTAARPYKKPLGARAARTELVTSAGSHFDPAVVRSFLNISIGRLWRGIGFAALLAQLPLLGALFHRGIAQQVGREVANLSAAGALVVGMAAVGFMDPAAAPTTAPRPPVAAEDEAPEHPETETPDTGGKGGGPKLAHSSGNGTTNATSSSGQDATEESAGDNVPREDAEDRQEEPDGDEDPREPERPSPQEREEPPDDYFASGNIAAATPTSSVVGGATQREFLVSCDIPRLQGTDGWVFPVPDEAVSMTATAAVSGATDAPIGYDLDAFFYTGDCVPVGAFQSSAPDERGPLPLDARYVVVNQPKGLDTRVTLAVTH